MRRKDYQEIQKIKEAVSKARGLKKTKDFHKKIQIHSLWPSLHSPRLKKHWVKQGMLMTYG